MGGYYKYLIIAFLVGGVVLVGAFLYQNYNFKQNLQTAVATPTDQTGQMVGQDEGTQVIDDISDSVVSVSNTEGLAYGLFDSVETGTIFLTVDGQRTEFPVEASDLQLMCTDQPLYEVSQIDFDKVNSNSTLSFEEVNNNVASGDPVVILSNSNDEGIMIAYALVKTGTGCNY